MKFLAANIMLFLASFLCLTFVLITRNNTINGKDILRETTFFCTSITFHFLCFRLTNKHAAPFIETMSPIFETSQSVTYPVAWNESILRQPPSPEVDAYWDHISDIGMMPMSENHIRGLGKDPSTVMKAPSDWQLGDDAYLVQLDGLHLLHCLNSMRRSLHYNYAYYYKRGHSSSYMAHLSHCQEALAHWLMCHPSMDLIKFDWVENHSRPFPDFDISRKCMNFEGLLEWQEKHRLPEKWLQPNWQTMEKPKELVPKKSPILNEESKVGDWVSLRDSFRAAGMPTCQSWVDEST